MENYVKKFHNLGGSTISAHKKEFSLYLKGLRNLNKRDIEALINALKPRNLQEEIFYVKILLTHEDYKTLLRILPNGNKILNRIIAKDKTFVNYFSENVPADKFVSEICPKISYVCRVNLINRLSQVLALADEYFFKIKEVYGLRQASSLLISCSEKLIRDFILETSSHFNDWQLIEIHKKHKNFLEFYFNTTNDPFRFHDELGSYLLKNDPDTFEKLRGLYGTPQLGKRTFIKYFITHRRLVLRNPNEFTSNYKVICHSLNKAEYYEYLKLFFPEDLDKFHFNEMMYKVLSRTKLENRGKIFFKIYNDLYGTEFKEFNKKLVDLLSTDDRQRFDLKRDYVYYPVTKSIPFIKEKINFTSDIDSRIQLVVELIVTCKVNRDEGALLEVLEYSQRFKNDNVRLRNDLMSSLIDNFELEKLSDEHWRYIQAFILMFKVNGEEFYNYPRFLEKLILNKIGRNLDYSKELREYAEVIGVSGYMQWRILTSFPKIERQILMVQFPKIIDSWKKQEEVMGAQIKFLAVIADFNKSNKKLRISMFEFERYLRNTLARVSDQYFWTNIVKDLLITPVNEGKDDQLREEILDKYIRSESTSRSVFYWLLKYKPAKLKPIAYKVITMYLFRYSRFYYELNKMHYTDIPHCYSEAALKIFNNTEKPYEAPSSIKQLSYREDFFELIKKFEPEDCVVDLHKWNMDQILNMQCEILSALKGFARPSLVVEVVLKYCKKDFFRHALEPLYHTLYHLSQDEVEVALPVILSRAVSVRKHAVFLATKLGSLKYIFEVLNNCAKNEKNASVKKFVFRCIYQTFLGDPTEASLRLFKENLSLINEKDNESLDMVVEVNKIPKSFQSRYIKIIWYFTKSFDKQLEFVVIKNLSSKVISDLPEELLDEILTHSLFNSKNDQEFYTNEFVYHYLLPTATLSIRIQKVFKLIKTYSESTVDAKTKLTQISGLITDLWRKTLYKKDKELIAAIDKALKETTLDIPTTSMKIEVDYTNFYVRNDPSHFPKHFLSRLNSMVADYGSAILQFFVESSEEFLKMVLTDGDSIGGYIDFVEKLLEVADSVEGKLVVLNLLPGKSSTKKADYLQRIDKILNGIRKESLVQVYYSIYLMK